MTERNTGSNSEKQPKLPFSETQRVYREGVENLIRPMLDDPESELSRRLEAGDPAFVDAGNDGGNGRIRRLIPIALPIDYQTQKLRPENAHNMAQVFLNGDDKLDETLPKVGDYFSVSKQAVNQNSQKAVFDVFPLVKNNNITFESLNFAKPLSDASRDRFSADKGGISLKIRNLVQEGADYKKLREAGFTSRQIRNAWRKLANRQQPIRVPMNENSRRWEDVLKVLNDPGIDRAVKRELILDISKGIYQVYAKRKGDRPALFVDVSEVAQKAGLHPSTGRQNVPIIADYLRTKCIPVGYAEWVVLRGKQKGRVQRYTFVLKSDEEEAIDLLKEAQGERFEQMGRPKVIYYGPLPAKIPNTSDWANNHEEYRGVFGLLAEFGVTNTMQLAAKRLTLSHLIQDPPVAVFSYEGRWKVHKDNAEELKQYLGNEIRRRGVILSAPSKSGT